MDYILSRRATYFPILYPTLEGARVSRLLHLEGALSNGEVDLLGQSREGGIALLLGQG